MRQDGIKDKKFCEATGKLHMLCPHMQRSGVHTPVVIRDGCCYRSCQCMVFQCKFNPLKCDIERILSVTW